MKTFRLILPFLFIVTNSTSFGQSQKRQIDFESENFIKTVQITFDSLKEEQNLDWIYFKIARFDTAFHSYDTPPPPNFITSLGFSDLELRQEDFKNIKILNEHQDKLFELNDTEINTEFHKRKKKYGNGLVYSLPYFDSQDNKKLVDIEIINWGYSCGTNCSLTIELKK